MSHPDRVIVELLVAAPIETVWKALKDPKEVCRWFGWEYSDLVADTEAMWSRVTVDEERHIIHAGGVPDRFEAQAFGQHTLVRVIRSAPVTHPGWQGIYDDVFEGWQTFFNQLKFALERHPGEERRTLYFNGRAKTAGTPTPLDALGLSSLWVVPVNQRYSVKTVTGDQLEGTVFFRSANQVGMTVDAFGDGLLIASTRPKTEKSLHGGGSILITTYGLADAKLGDLRERWSEWWTKTYEVIAIQP